MFDIGQKVKLIVPVVTGEIVDTEFDKESKQLKHLLSWQDGEETHSRWFLASELEAV